MPRRTAKPLSDIELVDQVRRAMPIAQSLIGNGIDPGHRMENELLEDHIAQILGVDELEFDLSDRQRHLVDEALNVARALGIAIGLCLRPEFLSTPAMLPKDGAR